MLEKMVEELKKDVIEVKEKLGELPLVGVTIGAKPGTSNWHFSSLCLHSINTIEASIDNFVDGFPVTDEEIDSICDSIVATSYFLNNEPNPDELRVILKPVLLAGQMSKYIEEYKDEQAEPNAKETKLNGLTAEALHHYKLAISNLSAIVTKRKIDSQRG